MAAVLLPPIPLFKPPNLGGVGTPIGPFPAPLACYTYYKKYPSYAITYILYPIGSGLLGIVVVLYKQPWNRAICLLIAISLPGVYKSREIAWI